MAALNKPNVFGDILADTNDDCSQFAILIIGASGSVSQSYLAGEILLIIDIHVAKRHDTREIALNLLDLMCHRKTIAIPFRVQVNDGKRSLAQKTVQVSTMELLDHVSSFTAPSASRPPAC